MNIVEHIDFIENGLKTFKEVVVEIEYSSKSTTSKMSARLYFNDIGTVRVKCHRINSELKENKVKQIDFDNY